MPKPIFDDELAAHSDTHFSRGLLPLETMNCLSLRTVQSVEMLYKKILIFAKNHKLLIGSTLLFSARFLPLHLLELTPCKSGECTA